jgi:RIO kinase 1
LLSEEEMLLMASASHHLTAEDAAAIQLALQEVEEQQRLLQEQQQEQQFQQLQKQYGQEAVTAEEEAAIQRALREADEEEESRSLQLALMIHEEETRQQQQQQQQQLTPQRLPTANVRVMTRSELAAEQNPPPAAVSSPGVRAPHAVGAFYSSSPPRRRHPLEEEEEQRRQQHGPPPTTASQPLQQQQPSPQQRLLPQQQQQQSQQQLLQRSQLFDEMLNMTSGGVRRVNANSPGHAQQQQQSWARIDRSSIVGPNRAIRPTKHDIVLQGQANAQRLALDVFDDEATMRTLVGNTAYNSFLQSTKQRNVSKGVASHGTGRANSDADATKGGAMDSRVRLQISRAINNGLIEQCNGVVKEGKEAIIYHADQGTESGGFDVAVKVFKRTQEFRSRVDYAEGDPRYTQKSSFRHSSSDIISDPDATTPQRGGDPRFTRRSSFRNANDREQLELWTEKEYRNLLRANRAGVPVPTPLFHKENVLFMRFLGPNGWPSPQLRELNLKRGSTRWHALYLQIMRAVRR